MRDMLFLLAGIGFGVAGVGLFLVRQVNRSLNDIIARALKW